MNALNHPPLHRQSGVATLAIGMLLLLLITLVVLYSTRSTILEQRIASNDYQAKMVQAAATAGLNHAIEHINANARVFNTDEDYTYTDGTTVQGWLNTGDNKWNIVRNIDCSAAEPADTVEAYRYRLVCESGLHGNVYFYDADGDPATSPGSVEADMDVFAGQDDPTGLNAGRTGTEFRTAYNVDFALCPLNIDPAANPKVQDPPCTNELEDARWYAIVVASEGFMVDANGARIADSARAEAHEVVVKFDVLGAGPSVPLMVSGNFGGGGTFDIVANPNGGAAPATGGKSGAPFSVWTGGSYDLGNNADSCQLYEFYANHSDSTDPKPHPTDGEYTVCFSCSCPSHDQEMLLSDGELGDAGKGIDILENDPNFPDDLFQYIFGVPKTDHTIIEDIARANSQYVPDCTRIDENASGLWWVTGDCTISTAARPSAPIVLVVEGKVTMNNNAKLYGVLYAFESADLKLNGGAQVYGAVIGDNVADATGSGNHSIVYDQAILDRVLLSPDLVKISRLPGTWSDRTMTQ